MNFCKILANIQDQWESTVCPGLFKTLGSFHEWKEQSKEQGPEQNPGVGLYLEADVTAPLPLYLQLRGLLVAALPQLQPHLIIDVKQVMSVISGIVEHFLRQRSRVATENTVSHLSPGAAIQLVYAAGAKTFLVASDIKDSLPANTTVLLASPASSYDKPLFSQLGRQGGRAMMWLKIRALGLPWWRSG